MSSANRLGKQEIQRLVQDLVRGPPEHTQGGGVHEPNPVRIIDRDDRVVGAVDDGVEPVTALTKRGLEDLASSTATDAAIASRDGCFCSLFMVDTRGEKRRSTC